MKKLLAIIAITAIVLGACGDDDTLTWEDFIEWRDTNNEWFAEMMAKTNDDGSLYYEAITPSWSPNTTVLIHYFNDRSETEGNLSPLYTSTVDVRYILHLCDGTAIDSSSTQTSTGTLGVYRAQLNQMIVGWGIGIPHMRCGDTAEIIVPYAAGYGTTSTGSVPPFSHLRFNVRLLDVHNYESTPYGN